MRAPPCCRCKSFADLALQVLETLVGLGIISWAVRDFQPLPDDLFRIDIRQAVVPALVEGAVMLRDADWHLLQGALCEAKGLAGMGPAGGRPVALCCRLHCRSLLCRRL